MNILITGASRGIGKVIAQEFCSLGNVFVTGRNEELLKDLNCKYCICDLSNNVEKLCNFIEENEIDILINNAGEYIYGAIEEMSSEQIEQICSTNLIAPIKLIGACVPHMKSQKFGRIVNIGSISGVMGEAYASLYSSTKSGLIGLTKALALELAEHNITINTINPGWVDTELGSRSIEDSEFSKEEIIETLPQRRFVEPSEVANLVKYLTSEEAKSLTGQSINLCAGLSVGI